AVDLDSNLAQPQFAGDLLVHQASSDEPHHLAFTLGQAVEACPHVRQALLVISPAAIALDRRGDRVQHVLIAEGLGQKIDGAGFHGLDRHGDIAVAGHEYDGNVDVRLGELGLEIEPAYPRHLTSSTSQRPTSASSLRKNSAAEPNVSTLRLTDRNRLLSASRTDSSSSTMNTIGASAAAGWRAERSITGFSPGSRTCQQ